MKVIAFNGSSRKNGNTTHLLNLAMEEIAGEGIETELVGSWPVSRFKGA